jgi:pantoate--beta-alanine ligase
MLNDVRRGLQTEIDFINGFIIKEADKLGLDVPHNKQIHSMVNALEKRPQAELPQVAAATSTPVLSTVQEMRKVRRAFQGKVGFVPTMGGLHDGHLGLIKACRDAGCDHVVVSIFVNGSQFAAHEDFDKYPRNHDEDLQILAEKAPVDAVFAPTGREIYPHDPRGLSLRTRIEPVDILGEPEALARPHFFGVVATICTSLFNIVQPDVVAFGQKDALQCAVIQNIVEDLHMPIEVVVMETHRVGSGLAMSTRNKYLTETLRERASMIPAALEEAADSLRQGGSLEECKGSIQRKFSAEPLVSQIEYVTIADRRSGREIVELEVPSGRYCLYGKPPQVCPPGSEAVISIAIKMKDGDTEVRLIDNVCVPLTM